MEKISGIVRGNPRVTTADSKNTAPARTGMPAFGRPPGESTPTVAKTSSTASRAVALHNGMTEAKKAVAQERVISQMADDFFMSKARPEVAEVLPVNLPVVLEAASTDDLVIGKVDVKRDEEIPSGDVPAKDYTPRGSYVDVRA